MVNKDKLYNGLDMYISDYVSDLDDIKKSEMEQIAEHIFSLYKSLIQDCSPDEDSDED
jgi:hypothetical protein